MSKINEEITEGFSDLSKFQKIVMTVSREKAQDYASGIRAQQIFVSMSENDMLQLNRLTDLWRKYYRSTNHGDIIGTACHYLWRDIKEDEEKRNEQGK